MLDDLTLLSLVITILSLIGSGWLYFQNRRIKGQAHLMIALRLTREAPKMLSRYRSGRLKQCSHQVQKTMILAYQAALQDMVNALMEKRK